MTIKQSRYITADTTGKKEMTIRTTELDKVKDDPCVRKSEVQQTVNNSTLPVSSRAVKLAIDSIESPSLDGYATEDYVDQKLDSIDLSSYASTAYVDGKLEEVGVRVDSADEKATEALNNSSESLESANTALESANTALSTAQDADGKAQNALDTAQSALDSIPTDYVKDSDFNALSTIVGNKRDLDDNVFNGLMTIKSDNDEQGVGVLLQESDGTVRGQVVATDQGLQLTQYPKDGGLQTFTFPSESGEVLTDGGGKWILPESGGSFASTKDVGEATNNNISANFYNLQPNFPYLRLRENRGRLDSPVTLDGRLWSIMADSVSYANILGWGNVQYLNGAKGDGINIDNSSKYPHIRKGTIITFNPDSVDAVRGDKKLEYRINVSTGQLVTLHDISFNLGCAPETSSDMQEFGCIIDIVNIDGITVKSQTFKVQPPIRDLSEVGWESEELLFRITENNQNEIYNFDEDFKIVIYFTYHGSQTTSASRRMFITPLKIGLNVFDTANPEDVIHSNVDKQDGKFMAWTSAYGTSVFEDGVVIGYEIGDWEDVPNNHDVDFDSLYPVLTKVYNNGSNKYVHPENYEKYPKEFKELPSSFIPNNNNMIFFDRVFWITEDSGETYSGAYKLNLTGSNGKLPYARNAYEVLENGDVLLYATMFDPELENRKHYSVEIYKSTNACKSFTYFCTIHDMKDVVNFPPSYNKMVEMPSVASINDQYSIVVTRERLSVFKYMNVYIVDKYNGRVSLRSRPNIEADNPPSLTYKNGVLYLCYATRNSGKKGIVIQKSLDLGITWSTPKYLRDGARNWDIGYCVSFWDADELKVFYYWSDSNPYQRIDMTRTSLKNTTWEFNASAISENKEEFCL